MSDSDTRKIELAEEILVLSFVSPSFLLESMFLFAGILMKFSETEESENIDEQKIVALQKSASDLSISHDKKLIKLFADNFTEEELETLFELINEPLILRLLLLIGTGGKIKVEIQNMHIELIEFIRTKLKDILIKIDLSKMN
ncbi:MAG: hypothetical protein L3J07_02965 [Candidatus Magasanikbacteria bacterium]|nr:hypothetical protein [Candidatus Magasanikbacteria bacterium]